MAYLIGNNGLALQARSRFDIENEMRPQMHPDRMRAAKSVSLAVHPAIACFSLRSTYNCVGMALASRRTWVDSGLIDRILQEDGYRRIAGNEVLVGDLCVYRDEKRDPVHIGVIAEFRELLPGGSKQTFVLSQWGADGEYLHPIAAVPVLLGSPSDFWTFRDA